MSADMMPCGCYYHLDHVEDCRFPKLLRYVDHAVGCSRGLPSANRPCNCGLMEMLMQLNRSGSPVKLGTFKSELEKRKQHPEYAPWDQNTPPPLDWEREYFNPEGDE